MPLASHTVVMTQLDMKFKMEIIHVESAARAYFFAKSFQVTELPKEIFWHMKYAHGFHCQQEWQHFLH